MYRHNKYIEMNGQYKEMYTCIPMTYFTVFKSWFSHYKFSDISHINIRIKSPVGVFVACEY